MSSISNHFVYENKIDSDHHGTVVLVDGHNLAFRNLYSVIMRSPEDNGEFELWKHQMMNSLIHIVDKFNPDKLVLGFDTKESWRYGIYSDYKAHRKVKRSNSKIVIDFDLFFPIFEKFVEDIKTAFPNIYVLKSDNAEADDIIAVLAKNTFKKSDCVIISSDGDLNQLITDKVQQYDPIKCKMVECLNPKRELELKILRGDASDNIKGIKRGVGVKTAEKIFAMGVDEYISSQDEEIQEEIKKRYKLNTQLINLDFIPVGIVNSIIEKYEEYEIGEINKLSLQIFFNDNKFFNQMMSWNKYSDQFRKLK
jgi:DNA polymerase-1